LAAAVAVVATVGVMNLQESRPAADAPALANVPPTPAQVDAVAAYEPVAAANVLYEVKDEGAVNLEGETAARQVRARFVDTYTWKNPRTNASLKWTVPRDEVRVIPASYHPN
jgi:hypothetical protein